MSNPKKGPSIIAVMNNTCRGFHTFPTNATLYIRQVEQLFSLLRWYSQTSTIAFHYNTRKGKHATNPTVFRCNLLPCKSSVWRFRWLKKNPKITSHIVFDYLGRRNENINLGCRSRRATNFWNQQRFVPKIAAYFFFFQFFFREVAWDKLFVPTLFASRSAYTTNGHFWVFSRLANSSVGDSKGFRISSGALFSQKNTCFLKFFLTTGVKQSGQKPDFGPLFCLDLDRVRKWNRFENVFISQRWLSLISRRRNRSILYPPFRFLLWLTDLNLIFSNW